MLIRHANKLSGIEPVLVLSVNVEFCHQDLTSLIWLPTVNHINYGVIQGFPAWEKPYQHMWKNILFFRNHKYQVSEKDRQQWGVKLKEDRIISSRFGDSYDNRGFLTQLSSTSTENYIVPSLQRPEQDVACFSRVSGLSPDLTNSFDFVAWALDALINNWKVWKLNT